MVKTKQRTVIFRVKPTLPHNDHIVRMTSTSAAEERHCILGVLACNCYACFLYGTVRKKNGLSFYRNSLWYDSSSSEQ